jgi:methyl-accepting chemotaxis protein
MTNANTSSFKKLKAKIIALFTAGLFTIGAIAIISNIMLWSQIAKYQQLVAVENNAVAQIGALNLQFKIQVQEWKNVLLRGHQTEDRETYWERFVHQHKTVQQFLLKSFWRQALKSLDNICLQLPSFYDARLSHAEIFLLQSINRRGLSNFI